MPKDLQHCHALVALVFDDEDGRSTLVATLAGAANLDATVIDSFTHDGRPGAVIHMRYRARGANMNDMPRRLAAAAKAADVEYEVLHEPRGFAVKRPELEQDLPPRATTEPTEPIQADWTQATDVHGPDAPFQGALRVPLAGPVNDEWLAALTDVQAGTDVLEVIVDDGALYVPDPWREEPALTQAGEARHALREEATKFLNLVNDQFRYRMTPRPTPQPPTLAPPPPLSPEEAFDRFAQRLRGKAPAQVTGAVVFEQPMLHVENAAGDPGSGATLTRAATDKAPSSQAEAYELVEVMVEEARRSLGRRGSSTARVGLSFRTWVVGDEVQKWRVVHVFDREREATYQAAYVLGDDGMYHLEDWTEADPARRAAVFAALHELIRATDLDPPATTLLPVWAVRPRATCGTRGEGGFSPPAVVARSHVGWGSGGLGVGSGRGRRGAARLLTVRPRMVVPRSGCGQTIDTSHSSHSGHPETIRADDYLDPLGGPGPSGRFR